MPSNWSYPVPTGLRLLGRFLLQILMLSNFSSYIKWTGKLFEFQIINEWVVFTEWREFKETGYLTDNEDPKQKWLRVNKKLISDMLVKNSKRGLYTFNVNGTPFIMKSKGMKGGYLFTNEAKLSTILGMPLEEISSHIAKVTEGQPYPDVHSSSKMKTSKIQAVSRSIYNPYAYSGTLEYDPPSYHFTNPSNISYQPCSSNEFVVPTRPYFDGTYYPREYYPNLYPSSSTNQSWFNFDPSHFSTAQYWPPEFNTCYDYENSQMAGIYQQELQNYREPSSMTPSINSTLPFDRFPISADCRALTSLIYHETPTNEEIADKFADLKVPLKSIEHHWDLPMLNAMEIQESSSALSDSDAVNLSLQIERDWARCSKNTKFN